MFKFVLKDLSPIFCIKKIRRKDICRTKNKKVNFHFLPNKPIFSQQITCTVQGVSFTRFQNMIGCWSRNSSEPRERSPSLARMLSSSFRRTRGDKYGTVIGSTEVVQLLYREKNLLEKLTRSRKMCIYFS